MLCVDRCVFLAHSISTPGGFCDDLQDLLMPPSVSTFSQCLSFDSLPMFCRSFPLEILLSAPLGLAVASLSPWRCQCGGVGGGVVGGDPSPALPQLLPACCDGFLDSLYSSNSLALVNLNSSSKPIVCTSFNKKPKYKINVTIESV